MARVGAFDHEFQRRTLFDLTVNPLGRFDSDLVKGSVAGIPLEINVFDVTTMTERRSVLSVGLEMLTFDNEQMRVLTFSGERVE